MRRLLISSILISFYSIACTGCSESEPTPESAKPNASSTEESAAEETPVEEVTVEETATQETDVEEVPEVGTAEVETPVEEVPEVGTAEVETPVEEVPEVGTAEVETPVEEVPEVGTAEVETPVEEVEEASGNDAQEDPSPTIPDENESELAVPWSVAIISLLVALTSMFIAFYLYRWRSIMLESGKWTVVPEEWSEQLIRMSGVVKNSQAHLEQNVQAQGASIQKFTGDIARQSNQLAEMIQNMMEAFLSMQKLLDEKDSEIKRLKTGYDQAIFKKFLNRFIRMDQRVCKLNDKEEVSSVDISNIKILLEDALEQCGVTSFEPELGVDWTSAKGVDDNPAQTKTDDQEKHETIAEVVSVGYELEGAEERVILIPAKVAVYTYETEREG